MTRAKQKIVAIVLAAVFLSVGIAGTVAYFTGASVSHNVIETAPGVHLTVIDEGAPVLPGARVQGSGVIQAEDDSATAWVRAKVEKSIQLADGVDGTPDLALIEIDFNETNWQDGRDGWWYYESPLEGGQEISGTSRLIEFVNFGGITMGNMYKNAKATVSIKVQGVQWKNNGSTALEAQGWPQDTSD